MKKILILLMVGMMSLNATAQEVDEHTISTQLIVQLHGEVKGAVFFQTLENTKVLDCLSKNMNIWLLESHDKNLLTALKENKAVKAVQYNHVGKRRSLIPNDSQWGNQWNMLNLTHTGADIHATEAWQLNHSALSAMGDSIVIAVIDGYFAPQHEDLNMFVNRNEIPNNLMDDDHNGFIDDYKGWNTQLNNDSIDDGFPDSHAMHCSGIAAAIGNNSIGVAGVCWGAKILAVNAINVPDSVLESYAVKAYDYVLEMRKLYDQTSGAKGAFVVATSSSFGIDQVMASNYPIWCALYDSLGKYGILSVAATANGNWNVDNVGDMPTTCPSKWLIAVTNTTTSDRRNGGAAYGAVNVDLGAPGTNITSCYVGNNYGTLTGTSMATPHIADDFAE